MDKNKNVARDNGEATCALLNGANSIHLGNFVISITGIQHQKGPKDFYGWGWEEWQTKNVTRWRELNMWFVCTNTKICIFDDKTLIL